MTWIRVAAAGAALAGTAPAAAAEAKTPRPPPPPVYEAECGSCHVAYPARFLGQSSWTAVLGALDQHFGTDASLDAPTLAAIRAYLDAGARSKPTERDGKPLLRISETSWFRHEHPRPDAKVWAHPEVRSPANCGACHREAASGSYRERDIRVPKDAKGGQR
jgi:hypothetical protein